ncbi:MAG TPA: sodium:solute symporter, partial [Hyphomonas sp.]|nr:sodium:solute symporter [Hyphomonas sp.]
RGERAWENRPIDAEESLDQALRVCDALARQSNTQVKIGTRASAAYVRSDPDRLSQVLINLISNAIKYNGAIAPVVEVRSRLKRGAYIIEVEDNGIGIAQEEQPRIFDKFYRGRLGETGPYAGAGLGLPISREIISRMDGVLELVSTREEGACFRITLPLITQSEAGAAQ